MDAGMVGREEGEGDRSSEGARGRSTKLGHWSFIHITRPFMRFANRSAFMLSTHFFVFFENLFSFLSLVPTWRRRFPDSCPSSSSTTCSISLLFTLKVKTKSRRIWRRGFLPPFLYPLSVIEEHSAQIPLWNPDVYFILENCIANYSQ